MAGPDTGVTDAARAAVARLCMTSMPWAPDAAYATAEAAISRVDTSVADNATVGALATAPGDGSGRSLAGRSFGATQAGLWGDGDGAAHGLWAAMGLATSCIVLSEERPGLIREEMSNWMVSPCQSTGVG